MEKVFKDGEILPLLDEANNNLKTIKNSLKKDKKEKENKEKKETLRRYYIDNCDKYKDTLCYSSSRGEISDKQNANLSYSQLTNEEKEKIKTDMKNSQQ